MPDKQLQESKKKLFRRNIFPRFSNTARNQPQRMRSKFVEHVVLQLIFVRGKMKHLMLTRSRGRPSNTVEDVSDWYIRTLASESSALEPGIRAQYREWRIFSGDENLFTVGSVLFEQLYIILGSESYHWIFYKNNPSHLRIEGSGHLRFPHCGCCIFNQYQRIVEQVKAKIILQRQAV